MGQKQMEALRCGRATLAVIEQLERRALLSVTLHHGVLRVVGTDGADQISINASGDSVRVMNDSEDRTFDLADVRTLRVSAGGGDDRVNVAIKRRAKVYGGDGNDNITGGAQAD